ncbi:MAG: fused MFS/spermidine synthase [candidate division WOR-3 bacterium]
MSPTSGPFYIESFFGKHLYHYKIKNWILRKKTNYQLVDICELEFFGKTVFLDEKIQSAQVDEFIYHEALTHPAMLLNENPEEVYIIGGGEGATLREVLKHNVKRCIMCDIDEEFVKICKEYLPEWHMGSFDDKRSILIFKDARKELEERNDKFDVIISDLTEPIEGGPSSYLFTLEFYEIIKKKLKDNGIFATQAGSTIPYYNLFFCSIYKTLKKVFEFVLPYEIYMPSFNMSWGFFIASSKNFIKNINCELFEIKIKDRNIFEKLKFLTPPYLEKIFIIPKNLKKDLEEKGRILRDEKPFVWEIEK